MGGLSMYGMGTRADPSFSEELDANNSVSRLILSDNLLYNLYSFAWALVHLEESLSSKMAYVEWKMIFSCVCHIK